MRRFAFASLFLAAALVGFTSPSMAAPEEQAPTPAANRPAPTVARSTNVSVSHEGTDSIGIRLGTRLKESFNRSNLFKLTEKDGPAVKLIVTTRSEFNERPAFGSVYAIEWVFVEKEGYLPLLLTTEVGTVDGENLENIVARFVERTDGISVKYGYLLKK